MKKNKRGKSRPERERELIEMAYSKGGPAKILKLYKQAIGMPEGQSPAAPTDLTARITPATVAE